MVEFSLTNALCKYSMSQPSRHTSLGFLVTTSQRWFIKMHGSVLRDVNKVCSDYRPTVVAADC